MFAARFVPVRPLIAAVAAGFLFATVAPAPAAAAGFFETLFGIRPQPAVAPAAQPAGRDRSSRKGRKSRDAANRQAPANASAASLFAQPGLPGQAEAPPPKSGRSARGEKRRKAAKVEKATGGGSGPLRYVRPQRMPGPYGHFLMDPTLRRGDIVVTDAGLKVFMGRGAGGRHSNSDFVALSKAGRNSAELRAIERANNMRGSRIVLQSMPAAARTASAEANVDIGKQAAAGDPAVAPQGVAPIETRRLIDIR